MDINYYMEFLVLTEVKNFSVAADMLFLSGPTLSRHIKGLETELGITLFDRNQHSVELTSAGREILPYAKQIVSARNHINFVANRLQSSEQQTVNIANTYSLYRRDDVFSSRQSNIRIRSVVNHEGTPYSLDRVKDGSCELAVVTNYDPANEDFVSIPYATDRYAVVLADDHPLSSQPSLRLSSLRKEKFITFPEGYDCYNEIMDMCRSAGFSPDVLCTSNFGANILSLLPYGGISLLYEKSIRNAIERKGLTNIRVIPIEDPLPPVEVSLCFLKDRPLSDCARSVVEYVMSNNFAK